MDVVHLVADNVKSLREQKKLTLDAAAELTGVSRSMLAQIEKGDVNPTISVLWKIACGYKVSFSSLTEPRQAPVCVLRAADAVPLSEDDGRYQIFPAFAFDEQRLFETYRVVMAPGGALSARPHLAGCEESITVFAGSVEISVGQELHRLEPGDSIRFQADTDHGYRNVGPCEALLSMLIYYKP